MTETTTVAEEINKPYESEKAPLLSIQDLRVWFELRRFGFGNAGYVRSGWRQFPA
jgi:hypothetical protein